MADPLLTSLCSICHTLPHKYRCPRCFVLTCSLPCIRRHKQWAQCSGLRDPAAYVTRTDLATPKMIDHDYNYLTSLEREFDKADRDADARGFLLDEITYKGRAMKGHPLKGELSMKEALERCGVIVARAPKGMSRAKANQTNWSKKRRRLAWTVEWVHPDGRKEERECAEDRPLSEAYAEAFKSKGEYVTRKKRKIAKETSQVARNGKEDPLHDANSKQTAINISEAPLDLENIAAEPSIRDDIQAHPRGPASSHIASNETGVAPAQLSLIDTEMTVFQSFTSHNHNEDRKLVQAQPIPQEILSTELQHPSPFEFYLHAPSLPSKETVLIPLEQNATLACSLRDCLVLEYPTIYVLAASNGAPSCNRKVPEGYISKEDFFARAKKLLVEEVEEGKIVGTNEEDYEMNNRDGIDVLGRDFDAERVLKVLGEDLKNPG